MAEEVRYHMLRPAQIVALLLVVIACASVWPVVEYGEGGYHRVHSMTQADGQKWLAAHEHRAEETVWIYAVTALVALAAISLPAKFPRTRLPLLLGALVLALVSAGVGAWIGHAGGQVRHSEFRNGPPPPVPEEHEEH